LKGSDERCRSRSDVGRLGEVGFESGDPGSERIKIGLGWTGGMGRFKSCQASFEGSEESLLLEIGSEGELLPLFAQRFFLGQLAKMGPRTSESADVPFSAASSREAETETESGKTVRDSSSGRTGGRNGRRRCQGRRGDVGGKDEAGKLGDLGLEFRSTELKVMDGFFRLNEREAESQISNIHQQPSDPLGGRTFSLSSLNSCNLFFSPSSSSFPSISSSLSLSSSDACLASVLAAAASCSLSSAISR
jgi:hypothetical protein